MWEGPRESCGPTSAGGSSFKSLIWFKSISKFVLGGIRIGMGYMNLVTVISIIMYVGMHIINAPELSMQSNTYRGSHTTRVHSSNVQCGPRLEEFMTMKSYFEGLTSYLRPIDHVHVIHSTAQHTDKSSGAGLV